jgi:hypothetical protein
VSTQQTKTYGPTDLTPGDDVYAQDDDGDVGQVYEVAEDHFTVRGGGVLYRFGYDQVEHVEPYYDIPADVDLSVPWDSLEQYQIGDAKFGPADLSEGDRVLDHEDIMIGKVKEASAGSTFLVVTDEGEVLQVPYNAILDAVGGDVGLELTLQQIQDQVTTPAETCEEVALESASASA